MEDDLDSETPDQQTPAPDPEMRRRAEELLSGQAVSAEPATLLEASALLHELRVHRIELEMQNEELRHAQLELDAQRAEYFALFHLAPVGYLTLSEEGIVGEANLTAARLLGVARQDLLGQPFSAFVFAPDGQAYYMHLHKLVETEAPQTCELRLQPVGGEPFWALLESPPQGAADGEPLRYHLTFTDVHERVLAEEALRESQEQLASAVEGSGVGLWDWRPQTGEETFSERWAEIAGYTLAELAPTSIETWRDLCHPDDLRRADELLEEHFSGRSEIYACETRVRHKDGHWVWVLDRGKVSEWDDDGCPLRMTGTQLDISARKQVEEELRNASDRLALATRAGGVGVWDYDPVNNTLHWDEQMFRLYGITGKQFGGAYEAWQAGLHPDDRERGDAEIQAALRGEQEFDTEFRVLWSDGTIHYVRALALVQRDASGQAPHMIGTNWDITEQRREAEKVRETTALLSGLLASIPDIVFFKDTRGIYLGCNPAFARFAGREVAGIVGSTDHDLFGAEVADFFREQDEIMMALGEPRHNEEWIEYPDGARVLIDTHKAPLRDAAGQVIGLVGVSFDITARLRAETELRESETRLRDIVETMADWVWETDEAGVYTYSSQASAHLFGRSRGEVIGKTPFDFMPPDEAARLAVLFADIVAKKAPIVDLENWNLDADGERFCLLTNGVPVLDDAGNLTGYRGVDRDITERKRAEEALREAADRLTLATRAGDVGVWDWDVQSDTLTWDEQMFALYGITRERFGGAYDAWRARLHPDDLQRSDDEIQMALSGEKELDTDFRVLWPDGTVHIIRTLALVQRDASGRPARMIGTSRDITGFRQTETEIRRLQAEEALRQSEEAVLVAVAAERSRLARELHDSVTQALFAATLKCEVLQRSVELVTPQTAETLADLHRLTRGALAEMRTLLLEMRPDALSEVPLDELLRHLARASESRARIIVSLTTHGRPMLPPEVKLALYRIAQEALNNVVRHAQATRAWLDLRCSAAAVQLVVGDDGCGFDPCRARPGQLGLQMMHERAGAAGALLRVETAPGRGTLVTIEWPGGEE